MPKPNQNFKVAELKDYIRSHKLNIRLTQKKAELIADLKRTGNWDEGKKKKTKEKPIEKAKSPPPKKTPKPKVIKEKPVEKKVEKKVEPKVEKPVEKKKKKTKRKETREEYRERIIKITDMSKVSKYFWENYELAKKWNINDIEWDEPVGVEAPSGMMWADMPNDIRVVTWNAYDDQDMLMEAYVRLQEGMFNEADGITRFALDRALQVAQTQGWELPTRYSLPEPEISYLELAEKWDIKLWDDYMKDRKEKGFKVYTDVERPPEELFYRHRSYFADEIEKWEILQRDAEYREQYVRLQEGIFQYPNKHNITKEDLNKAIKLWEKMGSQYFPRLKTPLEILTSAIEKEQGVPVEKEPVDNSEFEKYEEKYDEQKEEYRKIYIDGWEYWMDEVDEKIYWDMELGWEGGIGKDKSGSDYRLLFFGTLGEAAEYGATNFEQDDIDFKNGRFSKYHNIRKKYQIDEIDLSKYRPTKKEQEQLKKGINIHPEFVDMTPEDLDTEIGYMANLMDEGIMFYQNIESDYVYYMGVPIGEKRTDYGRDTEIKLFPSIIKKYNLNVGERYKMGKEPRVYKGRSVAELGW